MSRLWRFPVERVGDNRLNGLLRELAEALEQTDDPTLLRATGQSLKMIGDAARSKAFEEDKRAW